VRRTSPLALIALGVVGAVLGFVVESLLVASGRPRFDPPLTLPFALVVIGVLIVLLAVPVRRSTRGDLDERRRRRIDPFYATRVVVLAKASALSGALLAGAGLGILSWLLTRSVVAGVGSTVMAVAAAAGAILLMVAGLVAEHLCTVPPDEHDDGSAAPAGG
jgi:membrane protease YdiL (CAAX protease family)